jgi:spermidine/putrescine transport system permease protein
MVVYYAYTDKDGVFSFDNFKYIAMNKEVYLESFWIALISTAICLLIAYPLALVMSRMTPRGQRMMNILIMLPMWMNFILRICSLEVILMPEGVLDTIFGFSTNPFYHTTAGVIVGIVYNYLPFMVLPIYTVMAKIAPSVLEAGRDLGCNGWRLLWKVIFPLSVPGVISGITMVFVPAASAFVIGSRLGGFNLIGDTIDSYYNKSFDMNVGGTLSFVLMVVIVISMVIMNHFDKDDDIVLV